MAQHRRVDRRTDARGTKVPGRHAIVQPGGWPVALLRLQAAAGNRAVSRLLSPAGTPTVQRCGSEVHAGCACAGEASTAAVQRATAVSARLAGRQSPVVQRQEVPPVTEAVPAGGEVRGGAPGPTQLTSPRFVGDPVLEACLQDRARLSPGARSLSVAKVQQALVDLEYDLGPAGADTVYGSKTAAAVRAFKRDQALGFEQFGDVGPGTMRRLDELFPGELPPCEADDVVIAGGQAGEGQVDRGVSDGGPTSGTLRLGFKIPGVHCQLRPPGPPAVPRRFGDLPPAVLARLTLHTARASQAEIDGAFQVFRGGVKQADSITQTPIFTDIPPVVDLQQGLINVAHKLNTAKPKGLAAGETVTLNIGDVPADSQRFPGAMQPGGTYRFTRFRLPGAQGEHMLIEFLGPSQLRRPPAGAAADRAAFEQAYQGFGYRLVGNFRPDEVRLLDQGLRLVGNRAMARAANLRFDRSGLPRIGSEEGSYTPANRTVTLVASALSPTATASGGFHSGQFTLNHEMGHALVDLDAGLQAEFNAAAKADGGPVITEEGKRSAEEHLAEAFALFTVDRNQLRAMRPAIFGMFNRRYG